MKRKSAKITTMKDLIRHLKENNKCTTDVQDVLLNNFEGFSLELFNNELQNSKVSNNHKSYTDEMKKFAMTLHFYSPKCYTFVRKNLCLPHPATIRRWLSSANCEVGYLQEVFQYLENECKKHDYLRDLALIFDSMSIRSQIIFDKKNDKYAGYVDLGGITDIAGEELATEALVFQIVSYTEKFKCPIAYFFINKISAELQQKFILLAIEKLYQVGIVVRSLTCDGCNTNLKTLSLLGCDFSPDNMCSKFKHPQNDSYIYCILDVCHMLKILRNAFAEIQLCSEKGPISFKFIEKLHLLQDEEDLKFANRLSAIHINFEHKKMNVRLAAQSVLLLPML